MNDPEEFFARCKKTMEYEVILSLLSGNDTQCFTTKQFIDARDKWLDKVVGAGTRELIGPVDNQQLAMARDQLLALPPQLITEVSPNTWAQPNGDILC